MPNVSHAIRHDFQARAAVFTRRASPFKSSHACATLPVAHRSKLPDVQQ
jgi:hypothetical protein